MSGMTLFETGLSAVLLLYLLWQEGLRPGRRRLALRRIASVVAVAALVLLVLPIYFDHRAAGGENERLGVVLTAGYDPDSVRAFIGGKDARIWSIGDTMPREMPGIGTWDVFGDGLSRERWEDIHPSKLIFHPTGTGTGLVSAAWRRKLLSGDTLQIQGVWSGAGRRPVKLILAGMGAVLDSMEVAGDTLIQLTTLPSQLGRAVYQFAAIAGKDTLEKEDIPVEVSAGNPLKVLMLASSPGFENRFLSGWLAEQGHAVAMRTTISRGKSARVFFHIPPMQLDKLAPGLLDQFDIVVADEGALREEGIAGLAALEKQVRERGLGVVIKLQAASDKLPVGKREDLFMHWPGAIVPRPVAAGDSAKGFYFRDTPGMDAIERDSGLHIVAGSSLYGAGRLVFLAIPASYPSLLAGNKVAYDRTWVPILRQAARPMFPEEDWTLEPAFPRVNEPISVKLESDREDLPMAELSSETGPVAGGGISVYLSGDPWLPFAWKGMYWPQQAGWQSVRSLHGAPAYWYTWPKASWKEVYRRERQRGTREFIAGSDGSDTSGENGGSRVSQRHTGGERRGVFRAPVPKMWFCALFLIAAGFLWVERKI